MEKNFTICICDDELEIRNRLKDHIVHYSFTHEVDISVIEVESASELLQLKKHYDVLFLDIRFGSKNIGIDIAEKLRNEGNTSIIVIISALKSMSLEGYRAEPFRFIVKPFSREDIEKVLSGCLNKLNRTASYLRIKSDFQTEVIRTNKILYIHSQNRKRKVVCIEDVVIDTWQSLNELMESLPKEKFAFSHKSYIVNLDMVDSVCNDTIMLKNQTEIPLSNHFKGAFMKALYFNADS